MKLSARGQVPARGIRHRVTAGLAVSLAGTSAIVATACSSGSPAPAASPATTSAAPATTSASASPTATLSGSITVFAAASLQGTFTTIGKQFEAAHPGVRVTFSFGGSSALAVAIINGAPADVFASAATKNMQQVVSAGEAFPPANFARNVMEVAVPPSNPAGVTSVSDLAKSSVKVALCQPQVPCGATAAKVFSNSGITVRPVTLQPDVKSVLTQVELGNVDAGLVYVTDVSAAGSKVAGVPIPASKNASTEYPIAPLRGGGNKATSIAFVDYVLSPAGQAVLAAGKFEKP